MKTIIQIKSALLEVTCGRPSCLKSTAVTLLKIIGCLILPVLLNACVTCTYAPNAQNVPLFKEKNDANVSTAFRFGLLAIGCDLQGAYAITDHLGVMANYSYFTGRESTGVYGDEYSDSYKSHLGEFGLGYYLPFKNKMVFETYAGFGRNKISQKYYVNYGTTTLSLGSSSYFIQPAIGFYHKNIEFAISTRFKIVNFNKGQFDTWLGQDPNGNSYYGQANHVAFLVEPAFTFRGGGEHVKFQVQAGFSVYSGNSGLVTYDPININIGLIFNIHGKKKSEVVE